MNLRALADLGCVLCWRLGYRGTPAEIHHLRTGMGLGQRNDDDHAIPLSLEHHRGQTGLHGMGRKAFERHYNVTELELLDLAQELLYGR
mgnify:FL=1